MSQHLNVYSQRGCIGCKPCESGGANVGRAAIIWLIIILTSGLGALGIPFFKKCQYCGHRDFMNKHATPAQQGQPQTANHIHLK